MDEGKLFYTAAFQPEQLVYDNGQPTPLPLRLACIVQQSREEFGHGHKRSEGFRKGAIYLLENGEPELAAFMLHQSVEQLFRGFHIAVTGQELKTHMLSDLAKHVQRYAPAVRDYCGAVTGDGRSLVALLEKTYVCGTTYCRDAINRGSTKHTIPSKS